MPTDEVVEPEPQDDVLTPAHEAEINRLLEEAARALNENRLTTPEDNNAYYRLLRVITLDPDNTAALQGISDIVERYLEWALADSDHGDYKSAIRYLNSAKSVDETHPNIPAAETQILKRQGAEKQSWKLSKEGVSNKSATVSEELARIGRTATQRNATVVISARSDEEGRWIYQQMNKASEDRVRASMEFGDPSVRLVFSK